MKVAVAAAGAGGLDDTVSPVFEASPSFTPVDVDNQEIVSVEVIVNRTNCVIGAAAADLSQDLVGRMFASAGISMYRLQDMPVRDAVKQIANRATDTIRAVGRGAVPNDYADFTTGCRPRQPGEDGQGPR
jgi:predicted Fe-Mo cluster-binding NifX family protein